MNVVEMVLWERPAPLTVIDLEPAVGRSPNWLYGTQVGAYHLGVWKL